MVYREVDDFGGADSGYGDDYGSRYSKPQSPSGVKIGHPDISGEDLSERNRGHLVLEIVDATIRGIDSVHPFKVVFGGECNRGGEALRRREPAEYIARLRRDHGATFKAYFNGGDVTSSIIEFDEDLVGGLPRIVPQEMVDDFQRRSERSMTYDPWN